MKTVEMNRNCYLFRYKFSSESWQNCSTLFYRNTLYKKCIRNSNYSQRCRWFAFLIADVFIKTEIFLNIGHVCNRRCFRLIKAIVHIHLVFILCRLHKSNERKLSVIKTRLQFRQCNFNKIKFHFIFQTSELSELDFSSWFWNFSTNWYFFYIFIIAIKRAIS